MDVKELNSLDIDATRHWYYRSKFKALVKMLELDAPTDILDVGAGSGVFSKMMIQAGKCDHAVCVDPAYPGARDERLPGGTIRFVPSIETVGQPLILMMDVLEHVEDDVALVRQYSGSMPSGGKVLATVPAFDFLWSNHDVYLGHLRRYTITSIENCLISAGLDILRTRFFFGALFPAVGLMRLGRRWIAGLDKRHARSDLRECPPWLNRALILLNDGERHLLFPFNRCAGLTIFCLAQKK